MAFSKKSPLSAVADAHGAVTAVIEHGCEFEGKLSFQGTVRIGGTFRGDIFTHDTLIVSEGARIYGEIQAGTVIISGEVNGTIKAKNRVEVHHPAVFRGDIFTPSLCVDEGVIFEGRSRMVHSSFAPIALPVQAKARK